MSDDGRTKRTPPHVSLRNLRRVSGRTLDDVCARVDEILGNAPNTTQRGSMSAIESGVRGPSQEMLEALAIAFELDPGDLVVDFEPRRREVVPA